MLNATSSSANDAAATSPSSSSVLRAAKGDLQRNWVEMVRAVVLGLATVASAWCAYQSSRWSGVQAMNLANAGAADRQAVELANEAMEFRSFDAQMFIQYVRARQEGHPNSADFLYRRFRPPMKLAVDAWLASNPFENAAAPESPLKMPQYVQPQQQQAKDERQASVVARDAARTANQHSDGYVLLTVAFASVLFVVGIGATFRTRQIQAVVAVVAWTGFLLACGILALMPVCPR